MFGVVGCGVVGVSGHVLWDSFYFGFGVRLQSPFWWDGLFLILGLAPFTFWWDSLGCFPFSALVRWIGRTCWEVIITRFLVCTCHFRYVFTCVCLPFVHWRNEWVGQEIHPAHLRTCSCSGYVQSCNTFQSTNRVGFAEGQMCRR